MGNFSRNHARVHHGLNINEFQDYCKAQPELEAKLDDWFVNGISAKTASVCGLIVDYRLRLNFFPEACSFLLAV
jgi:radical S-adenosyl methionine domain-containing protein 2